MIKGAKSWDDYIPLTENQMRISEQTWHEQGITVLHVVDSLNPGGMENGVVNVAGQLAPLGLRTHVACLRDRGSFADRLPDPQAVTLLGKGSGFSFNSVSALQAAIKRIRPDVVHTHNLGPLIYAILATLGGTSVPVLHGEHGQIQPQDLTPRRMATRRLLYKFCHTVHTVSGSLLEGLRSMKLRARRMVAITNGVDCDRYSPAKDKKLAKAALKVLPPTETTVLGIVGRFVALKRHLMLLSALEPVMSQLPDVHLLVVGDQGPERDTIVEAMRTHPHKERIHWLGMRSDMDACYPAMDLLVSSSEVEGLSNAVLEAMACGVPVLAHKACGNSEAVVSGQGGFLYELPDGPSLTRALMEILNQPATLHDQGLKARERVESEFSIRSMANGYHRIYKELAGRG